MISGFLGFDFLRALIFIFALFEKTREENPSDSVSMTEGEGHAEILGQSICVIADIHFAFLCRGCKVDGPVGFSVVYT